MHAYGILCDRENSWEISAEKIEEAYQDTLVLAQAALQESYEASLLGGNAPEETGGPRLNQSLVVGPRAR